MELRTFLECFPDTLAIVYDESGSIIFPEDNGIISYMRDCLTVTNDEYYHPQAKRYYKVSQMRHSENDHTYTILRFTDITEYKKKELAYQIDETTGVFLKRKLLEDYKIYLASAIDTEEDFAVVMSDIDYFKKVNDTYGHQAGDAALYYTAQLFLRNSRHGFGRENDIIGRFGGEEFLFILKNIHPKCVFDRVENLRKRLAVIPFRYKDKSIDLSCSFGVVHVNNTRLQQLVKENGIDNVVDKTIQLADEQLYIAKESGRNKVLVKYEQLDI